ncbi:hypothetical protein [Cupriavidus sp. H18C1]|uniref:hypothetical protein n=1 Tax=Cupriavidus sp. H18C1 TaxID=3241601 RepID=UPI003BB97394
MVRRHHLHGIEVGRLQPRIRDEVADQVADDLAKREHQLVRGVVMTAGRSQPVPIRPVTGLAYVEAGRPWQAARQVDVMTVVSVRDAGMAGGIAQRTVRRIAAGMIGSMAIDRGSA